MFTKHFYQYFTNVTYSTCPDCLAWHGKIAKDPANFPDPDDGCERKILQFPRSERKYRKEKQIEMQQLANNELERRKIFSRAKDTLEEDPEQALELFSQAAQIDIYVPELKQLKEERSQIMTSDTALTNKLKKLFTRAYSDKFGWPRYERLPELMRIEREKAGIETISSLFS